jgi:hypothetical protein
VQCQGNMCFGVMTAVNAEISNMRYVTPCSLVVTYQRRVMEAVGCYEMLVNVQDCTASRLQDRIMLKKSVKLRGNLVYM